MVRIRHFEFFCRSMHIEPMILLVPPKLFHEWKPKFFFIKAGVMPMEMIFRGTKDIVVENVKTSESEIWYQDLKDIPTIELPERALVAAGMSLHWKMDREDKPVYMEDDRNGKRKDDHYPEGC
ncbi:hypothetical protein Hanom_Chr05g00462291 [Helianthus anomalus]